MIFEVLLIKGIVNQVGTINRHGHIHDGHYEPWLVQAIMMMRELVGFQQEYDQAGIHEHALCFRPSKEAFGISRPLGSTLTNCGMTLDVEGSSAPSESSELQLSSLIILSKYQRQLLGSQYRFLQQRQKAKYAIMPVHTRKEKELFGTLMRTFSESPRIPWLEFARNWNHEVDVAQGKGLFYKTTEELIHHEKDWRNARTALNSHLDNRLVIQDTRSRLHCVDRGTVAPAPERPTALRLQQAEQNHSTGT